MKKTVIVLALVVVALVPVFAKQGFGIGLEAGTPSGLTFDFGFNDKWDGYATVGFGFVGGNNIDAVVGGEYKITDFKIDKAKFDVNVGLQTGVLIGLGKGNDNFRIAVRGAGSVSYDWTWKNVGDFTAFLRLAAGVGIAISGDNAKTGFSFAGALGLVYHF